MLVRGGAEESGKKPITGNRSRDGTYEVVVPFPAR